MMVYSDFVWTQLIQQRFQF